MATPPDGATKHTINGHAVVRTTRMRAGRVINAEVGSDNFCDETKEGGGEGRVARVAGGKRTRVRTAQYSLGTQKPHRGSAE